MKLRRAVEVMSSFSNPMLREAAVGDDHAMNLRMAMQAIYARMDREDDRIYFAKFARMLKNCKGPVVNWPTIIGVLACVPRILVADFKVKDRLELIDDEDDMSSFEHMVLSCFEEDETLSTVWYWKAVGHEVLNYMYISSRMFEMEVGGEITVNASDDC